MVKAGTSAAQESKKHKTSKSMKPKSDYTYEVVSRCSPQYFLSTMKEVKKKMGCKHLEALKKTPFYHFFEMPQLQSSRIRIEAVLKRFNVRSFSFRFGENNEVPFSPMEFSVVLGLHHIGQGVDQSLRMESSIVSRLFGGMYGNVQRKVVAKKLLAIVDREDDESLEDFIRLYVLFIFSCLLFPTSNYWLPRFLLPYVDNISRIGLYAWGDAAYNFLVDGIRSHLGGHGGDEGKRKYLDGCTIGLMAWVYERVPSLGTQISLFASPRLIRWGESKLPNTAEAAEEKLSKITKDKILAFFPTPEEQRLVAPQVSFTNKELIPATPVVDLEEVNNLLKARDMLINELRKRLEELEPEPLLHNGKRKGDDANEIKVEAKKKKVEEKGEKKVDEKGEKKVEEKGEKKAEEKGDVELEERNPKEEGDRMLDERNEEEEEKQNIASPICIQEESPSSGHQPMKKYLDKYRGLLEYKGRNMISAAEKQVLDGYMKSDKIEAAVWEGYGNVIESRFLCELMFGEELVGDVLDAWMCILRSPSFRQHCSHSIWAVSTIVQGEILARAENCSIGSMKDEDWPDFMDRLSGSSKKLLEQVNKDVIENCRYILIPVNPGNHWFLIVLDLHIRKLIYMNSIMTPTYLPSARTIAAFYTRYLRLGLGYRLDEKLSERKSRQQIGGVDCGVYVCLWAECFARDTRNFWDKAKKCDMRRYRAKMAHTILTHENSRYSIT